LLDLKKNSIILECDCVGEILVFRKIEDDEELYVEYYVSAFYREQKGIINHVLERLKRIWYAIINKDYLMYEVILDKDKQKSLMDFLKTRGEQMTSIERNPKRRNRDGFGSARR
jgi:hypothetical protein